MKKYLVASFAMLLLLLSVGCGGSSSNNEVKSVKPGSVGQFGQGEVKEKEEKKDSKKDTKKDTKKETKEETTAKEMVIFDKDGIKITFKSIDYDGFMGPELKFLVENDTDQDITVSTDMVVVNGLVVGNSFYAKVAAGKKVNDELTLYDEDLEMSNITKISEIELALDIYNSDTYADIFEVEDIVIKFNAGDYKQKYLTGGDLILDKGNVKVYVVELNEKESFFGPEIVLYVENNNDFEVTISSEDLSINGFMMSEYFYVKVPANRKAYDTIDIMDSDLEDNDIKKIESLELKFNVYNSKTYDDVVEDEAVKYEFK